MIAGVDATIVALVQVLDTISANDQFRARTP